MKRDTGIDNIRFLSNYMVVVIHAATALQFCSHSGIEYWGWQFICNCLAYASLPALFAISGWLMETNFSMSAYGTKVYRRLKRLIVPYICWNLLFVCAYLILSSFSTEYATRVKNYKLDTIYGIFSCAVNIFAAPIDGPLWFLRTLFFLSILFPLIHFLFQNNTYVLFILLFFVVCAHRGGILIFPAYSIVAFVIGAYLKFRDIDMVSLLGKRLLFLISIVGASCWFCVLYLKPFGNDLYFLCRNVCFILMLPFPFFVSKVIIGKIHDCDIVRELRHIAFFVYCTHIIVCPVSSHFFAGILSCDFLGRKSCLVILYISGISLIWIIHRLLRKCTPRFLAILEGVF